MQEDEEERLRLKEYEERAEAERHAAQLRRAEEVSATVPVVDVVNVPVGESQGPQRHPEMTYDAETSGQSGYAGLMPDFHHIFGRQGIAVPPSAFGGTGKTDTAHALCIFPQKGVGPSVSTRNLA